MPRIFALSQGQCRANVDTDTWTGEARGNQDKIELDK